jgi:predicted Rossmann-fold nucleotide-binding protein
VVYGGARIGCMGALADAALQAGGEVLGVMPQRLIDRDGGSKAAIKIETAEALRGVAHSTGGPLPHRTSR